MQHPRPSRLRSAFAVVAASALLVAGVTTVSEAAGAAKAVLLGKSNKETKTTKIINKKKKPALALKSKGSGPALSVNTTGLVKNLNADLLDGKSLDQVSPTTYTESIGTPNAPGPGTVYLATTSLPAGTYRATIDGLFSIGTGDTITCLLVDYTRLLANPTDINGFYVSYSVDQSQYHTGALIPWPGAGHNLLFACDIPNTSDVAQPMTLTLEAIDRMATVPGSGPFVPRPAANPLRGGALR